MLKQIENKIYDVDFGIEFKDESVEIYIKSMLDEDINIVDLNTIDEIDLKLIMRDYYQNWINDLIEEEEKEYWGINRELGNVRIINNTAILKHW